MKRTRQYMHDSVKEKQYPSVPFHISMLCSVHAYIYAQIISMPRLKNFIHYISMSRFINPHHNPHHIHVQIYISMSRFICPCPDLYIHVQIYKSNPSHIHTQIYISMSRFINPCQIIYPHPDLYIHVQIYIIHTQDVM